MDHIDITRKEMVRAGLLADCDCEICASVRQTLEEAETYNAVAWAEQFRGTRPCMKDCPGFNEHCGAKCKDPWAEREYWVEKWRARSD